jgi:vacuolar protein sorting-associated protein VTA1
VTIYVIMGDRDSLPANLKSMQPYLDMATDYESMDPFISYWCN